MDASEYFEIESEIVRNCYQDHIATWDGTTLLWAKPGTHNYSCTFILSGRYLCAIGDIGDAVYSWSETLTLDFLASCDWHYMLGKCQASPHGRDFRSWNTEVAKSWLEAQFADYILKADLSGDENVALAKSEEKEFEKVSWWGEELHDSDMSEESFTAIANLVFEDSGDAEMAISIQHAGLAPDCMFIAQFVGLQMAIKQITKPPGTT